MHELGAGSTGDDLRLRPRPQPVEHRALPGRLLERARRRGRRPPGRRRRRRRRPRLDPLSGRLLRPHRAEADLRPLGDGGPPHGVDHEPRSSPARSAPTPPTAACSASVLFGEELAAGDAAGLRIGVVRDAVSEDVTPEVATACEEAIEALRAETGGELREIELPDLEVGDPGGGPDRQPEALTARRRSGSTASSPELSPIARGTLKYRMLLPAAGDRAGAAGAHADAPPPGRPLRRRRRARLADGPGPGPAARGAAGRAALRHAQRRPGQRPRRRARQPDGDPRDQRPRRAQRRRPADRPAAAGRLGRATSCCSTPPRRSSGRTTGAGSTRRRRSPRPRRRRPSVPRRPRSRSRGWSAPSTTCSRCAGSTSRSPRARSTASSAPTAPARRRRCGC